MTDIVERLLSFKTDLDKEEAADEIIRLRASLAEAYERAAVVSEGFYRKSTFNSRVRSLGQETCDLVASAIRALKEGTT